ncbi:MAG TPA: efflux RND transporter periplasmic adaptor subunit, partial [Xanthobacteraceae bacterium]|nr:efflux RND transporter periplasmic adaptor subunit [Xanthobacteraceae bacterium]
MKKRNVVLATVIVIAAGVAAAAYKWNDWAPQSAVAQSPNAGNKKGGGAGVPVDVVVSAKKIMPVRVDLLGNVTPIASVAVKTRVDSEITQVHFRDGAIVKQGDMLFTLDGRAIEAQIKQTEGLLSAAKAQLEQNLRDVERYAELAAKNATTLVTLNNAKTAVNIFRGTVDSQTAQLELLRVQLDYTVIRAQISGRVSMAAVKVGNFARQADLIPLATIIQVAPVYVTFPLPQHNLPDLRRALTEKTAIVKAIIPGDTRAAEGDVTMIENTVDATTGTVPVRATMQNADELLWPGTLVSTQLTFRTEEAVVVPPKAVQVSQQGTFVFVVKNNVATVQPVKVARVL